MTFKEEIREILDILFDKLDELKLKYVIHTKEDEGYEKLCYDDSFIIDIINPLRSNYECYMNDDIILRTLTSRGPVSLEPRIFCS